MKTEIMFPSYSQFIEKSELIKRRQERLVQVRRESKEMAAALVERARKQAEKEFENTEQLIMNEIWEQHSKELNAMRRMYEDCILNINQQHYNQLIKKLPVSSNTRLIFGSKFKGNRSPVRSALETPEQNIQKNKVSIKTSQPELQDNHPKSLKKNTNLNIKTNVSNIKDMKSNLAPKRNIVTKNSKPVPSSKPVEVKKNQNNVRIIRSCIYREPTLGPSLNSKIDNFEKTDRMMTSLPINFRLEDQTDNVFNSYTLRVHDRIRILEQKEKLLQRRVALLPEMNVQSAKVDTANKLNSSDKENFAPAPNRKLNSSEKISSSKSSSTDPLHTYSIETNQQHPASKTSSSDNVQSITKTPISRDDRNLEKNSNSPRICKKRRKRCKKAELYNDEDLVIVVRNSRSVKPQQNSASQHISNSITTANTSTETESIVAQQRTTEKNLNVTANISKDNKSPKKGIIRTSDIDDKLSKKLVNWRKLFNTNELSDSSYLSPPSSLKKDRTEKKKCKKRTSKGFKNKSNDIEHYVAKLLLMSPENRENLNNLLSDDTISTISSEIFQLENDTLTDGSDSETETKAGKNQPQKQAEEDEDDSIDEAEFIRKMLEVNLPGKNSKTSINQKPDSVLNQSNQLETPEIKIDNSKVDFVPFLESDIMSRIMNVLKVNKEPSMSTNKEKCGKGIPEQELKNEIKVEQKLSNWIGTSIRRTLEASTMNSTSSNDDTDNFRQINQIMQWMVNRQQISANENSSDISALSLSPIRVPDVHLKVPSISSSS